MTTITKVRNKERNEVGILRERKQWYDQVPRPYLKKEKRTTTILFGGLTLIQDSLIEAALCGLGYKVKALDCPDNTSLQIGREFGNRGQCNPTYFTVGNLIKYLKGLVAEGKTKKEIIDNYVFITTGSCGPCRFGTYVTEYRKALRDSGFDGFRVLLFQQQDGLKQATGEENGIELNVRFFHRLLKAIFIGDILNILAYRIRPYEMEKGTTNKVIANCKEKIYEALLYRKPLIPVLLSCRAEIQEIKVDWTQVKPKVSVIGEFWAMTTEGDGNYKLQQFLESEGAEVEVQPVTAWILFLVWEGRFDTKRRINLKEYDRGKYGLVGKKPGHKLMKLAIGERAVRVMFQFYAKLLGLYYYELPNMDQIAEYAHRYYDNHNRGGEGHMEVGKLLLNVIKKKANMTISVKPFGCMPSSGVSDGIQSFITEKYPEAIFLPIETTGDGAVNVYSRVQMMLFKAKQEAKKEYDEAVLAKRQQQIHLDEKVASKHSFKHVVACSAANVLYDH
ncbi:2-hydroxyglutaryl-CoA dehydratase [Anaerobacillus alkalilacustris]|uniref:2-hydroxyglutaryl-CoA dehydratase n=1 Tax=Anaerobacillus alkalilacustris TaxID=393763 RepID=A0A1S2LN24_9BACI|nr:2-hydroxyglutaryl-CoA dehydratase [Anaerobacillus alkalilacustris]OIJ13734.1 2-hydroxyglutaryl-CoA dehydratase [Anaerobacillus alkalilacustris]